MRRPGAPSVWSEGVRQLAAIPSPASIPSARWTVYVVTCDRLLEQRGAELHGFGWGTLDLFGLHRTHPATNTPGWGLAWLLGKAGDVINLSAGAAVIEFVPGGSRLMYKRSPLSPDVVASWELGRRAVSCQSSHADGR